MNTHAQFFPSWASPPGDTIKDMMDEHELDYDGFCRIMNLSTEEGVELLEGRTQLKESHAKRLAEAFSTSADFWIRRESDYRSDLSRQVDALHGESWLDEIPLRDMKRFGWVPQRDTLLDEMEACLTFFGVPDVASWRDKYRDPLGMSAFRNSDRLESNLGSMAAWLRQGEVEAAAINVSAWNADSFKSTLLEARSLTRIDSPSDFLPELERVCASCGVACVIVRTPYGCPASGATRFVSADKAMLQLSFRFLSDDHFWFSFFHEAGHLLLHDKTKLFVEGIHRISEHEEKEANDFAAKVLIPPEFEDSLRALPNDGRKIMRFAKQLGISPGIVVGQLQHRGLLGRQQQNNLKRRYKWPT